MCHESLTYFCGNEQRETPRGWYVKYLRTHKGKALTYQNGCQLQDPEATLGFQGRDLGEP